MPSRFTLEVRQLILGTAAQAQVLAKDFLPASKASDLLQSVHNSRRRDRNLVLVPRSDLSCRERSRAQLKPKSANARSSKLHNYCRVNNFH